jgi:hypothetical protein
MRPLAIRPNIGTASRKRVKFATHAYNKTIEYKNASAIIKVCALALAGEFASRIAWGKWNVKDSGRASF